MSKDKMTEINIGITPTPWVAGGSFPYKGNEGYIFATSMRPEILVCKTFGSIDENTPPIGEQMENSKAIVSAVNGTYGAGINPEAVSDLLDVVKKFLSVTNDRWRPLPATSYEKNIMSSARAAIEKAKLNP